MSHRPRKAAALSASAAVLAALTLAAGATGPARADGEPASPADCGSDLPSNPTCLSGSLPDGTPYEFVVPEDWNGTVVVALDFAGETHGELTRKLLSEGVAHGGTTRTVTGWHIRDAIDNQARALARFEDAYGPSTRAIASGSSMGGFVSAGVAQVHPDVFDAAVPFCGGLGGSVAQWNQKLDTVFVLEQLVAPGLPVIDIPSDVAGAQQAWISALGEAQQTPAGRARIALASAIGQLPAWGIQPDGVEPPPPAAGDTEALQEGFYLALAGGPLPYIGQAMSSRRTLTEVVGGNPSWNTGVDYAEQFRSAEPAAKRAVRELYAQAGLSLDDDFAALASAPRIEAEPAAVDRFAQGLVFDGQLSIPVFAVSNIGDQISTAAQNRDYEAKVRHAGAGHELRQAWVESAGHCTFTPAEQVAALDTMRTRLDSGRWPSTSASALNDRAGHTDATGPSRFVHYLPPRFNRSYGE